MVSVFIDESGNLGRGGDYFTIAAIAFPYARGQTRLKRLIKRSCSHYSPHDMPLHEIKVGRLTLPQKQDILNKIAQQPDHDIFYITAKKAHVTLLQQGRDKNLVYNYLAGMLTTHITQTYKDDISLNFDQRTTKVASMNSLIDYVRLKVYAATTFEHALLVGQYDSRSMYNLQTADVLAGIINGSYIRKNKHLYRIIEPQIKSKIEFPSSHFGVDFGILNSA